jgi:hypothetical protein
MFSVSGGLVFASSLHAPLVAELMAADPDTRTFIETLLNTEVRAGTIDRGVELSAEKKAQKDSKGGFLDADDQSNRMLMCESRC